MTDPRRKETTDPQARAPSEACATPPIPRPHAVDEERDVARGIQALLVTTLILGGDVQ